MVCPAVSVFIFRKGSLGQVTKTSYKSSSLNAVSSRVSHYSGSAVIFTMVCCERHKGLKKRSQVSGPKGCRGS